MESYSIPLDLQLNSQLWNQLVKHRAGYTCENCGYQPPEKIKDFRDRRKMGLHAHHLDGNHDNDCLANGEVLCQSCHSSATRKHEWANGNDRGARASRLKVA